MHAAVADALPDDDVDRRAWHLSESLWAPDAGVAEMLDGAAAARGRAVRLRRRVHGLRAGRPAQPRHRRPGRPVGGGGRERVGRRPRPSGDRAAGRAGLAALAPELATSALELRASIAVRSGSVREAAALLERAAAETGSADARAVLLAEALHATLFLRL